MTEVLVSSTVLILALAALRLLLRGRIDPRLQYALWLLAALRLLLPVPLVSSPVSVMNAAADVPAAVQRLTAPEDRRAPQPAAEAAPAQPAAGGRAAGTDEGKTSGPDDFENCLARRGGDIGGRDAGAESALSSGSCGGCGSRLPARKAPSRSGSCRGCRRHAWRGCSGRRSISRPRRPPIRRRSALSCGMSWRISARRTSCGALCGSSASASTGSTPSSGWPRRWPGGTASWRATRGCCAGWTARAARPTAGRCSAL